MQTGYVLERYNPNSGKWARMPGSVSVAKINIKKLEEGHNYLFRVRAQNMYGLSEPLEGTTFLAKSPYGNQHYEKRFCI